MAALKRSTNKFRFVLLVGSYLKKQTKTTTTTKNNFQNNESAAQIRTITACI